MSMAAAPSHRRRLRAASAWALAAVLVGLASALAALAVIQWRSLDATGDALAERLATLDGRRPDLAGLERRLAALKANGPDTLGTVPGDNAESATAAFASVLQDRLGPAGVALDSPQSQPPIMDGSLAVLHVSLSGATDTAQIPALLGAIEAGMPLGIVETLEVNRLDASRVRFRALVRGFWVASS